MGRFPGTAIKGYVDDIGNVVRETGSKTLLDYGCGKAIYYREHKIHEKWGVPLPTLYDPGVPEYEKRPQGRFDGVICTDVMEHLENPLTVAAEIFGMADKFVFMAISCAPSPAKKRLIDGRPLHICVHEPAWWRERLEAPKGIRLELRFT